MCALTQAEEWAARLLSVPLAKDVAVLLSRMGEVATARVGGWAAAAWAGVPAACGI